MRARWVAVAVLAVAALGGGLFLLGRVTADHAAARRAGYDSGYDSGHLDGYFAGLSAGAAQGREEGRALQESAGLPADSARRVRAAFEDGYAAGANDVFAGYDGGWRLSGTYLVTIGPGPGAIVYRITGRDPLQPGMAYFLCPDGSGTCHEKHR